MPLSSSSSSSSSKIYFVRLIFQCLSAINFEQSLAGLDPVFCETRKKQEYVNALLCISSSHFLSRNRISISEKLHTQPPLTQLEHTKHNTQCKLFNINELSYNRNRDHPPRTLFKSKNYTVIQKNALSVEL